MKLQAQDQKTFITPEHGGRLPFIRITRAVLENFKNVEYGEIDFRCGKYFVPYGSASDILGLYGQNGSGKTAFIDALYILKELMRGNKVPDLFSECIAKGKKFARLTFVFELQYEDGRVRKAQYVFCLAPEEITSAGDRLETSADYAAVPASITGDEMPFGPKSRHKFLIGPDKTNQKTIQLQVNKQLASERSQSFIFMPETLKTLTDYGYSEYLQVILELNYYGLNYFFVVNTRSSGLIRLNLALLLHTPRGSFPIKTDRPTVMPDNTYKDVSNYISKVNLVIQKLIPGLTIELHTIAQPIMEDGSTGKMIDIMAIRNGKTRMPLRDESDGIRRMISLLSLLTAAYNDPSFTLAIDEFDAGIFEYIFGELLEMFEEKGMGQLIFTSHNLRPLEVIKKYYLYFTSTDPKDRYVQLKSIARTNNMRNVYFRQIESGDEERVYNPTQRKEIEKAFREAME